jgi:cytochrome b6-f complex iron-sulfur subunit
MTEKPVEKKPPRTKVQTSAGGDRGRMTRRKLVWYSVFGFLGVCTVATLRFFFPRVLFEPKTRLQIGYPSDYGIGVNTRYQASHRIWVVRDAGTLFVILARCPHLGCTPDWKESENKFKCPCHGSGFDTEGVNFEGPSPRPLDRLHVEVDAVGQIVVDKSRVYGREDWKKPGAFLAV